MLGTPFSEKLLHIEFGHIFTAIELVDADLDVAAEALELHAIQFDAVAVGIQRLGDEFIRTGVVTRGNGRVDELIEFDGELDSELAHVTRVGVGTSLVKMADGKGVTELRVP